jgi:NADH dehydrogenase
MDRRTVTSIDVGEQLETPFDHLVLALGAVPDYYGLPGLEEHAFTFKTLRAAIDLRNHVIDKLEDANDEDDNAERRAKLTFVVAGGGFAGTELVGALNDFIRGSLFYYSNIRQDDVSVILVHSSTRILPELSEGLAAYALSKLELRGVTCKCGYRVSGAERGKVLLSNGESIDAQTLVWTAGNTPNPLVQSIQGATTERGAIKTDSTFSVVGLEGVWAVGDCAWVPDAKTGLPTPATAQRALVDAPALTRNVHAVVNGRKPKAFHFESLGSLCLLGHHLGVAEVKGMKFSGLLAWIMWRLVYFYRLPTLERRCRVALDWLVDAFFPPDIVQTVDSPWPTPVLHDTSPHHGNLREEA